MSSGPSLYAHSPGSQDPQKWHMFDDHVQSVAKLAATFATVFGEGYNLKDGIKITGKTCGTENAFWYAGDREITYCYEMAAFHAGLIANWFENQAAGEEDPDGENVADEASEEETEATSVKLKRKE